MSIGYLPAFVHIGEFLTSAYLNISGSYKKPLLLIEREVYFDRLTKLASPDPTPLNTARVRAGSAVPGIVL